MKNNKQNTTINILLAEDDIDDQFFFEKALKQVPIEAKLTILNNGDQLMEYLKVNIKNIPDIIFLDISMPRKTGIECLVEILENELLNKIPIVMLSTSFTKDETYERGITDMLLSMGAVEYIRKPNSISELKLIIENMLKTFIKANAESSPNRLN